VRERLLGGAHVRLAVCLLGLALLAPATACGGASSGGGSGRPLVVAAENVWGSIVSQLGGSQVRVQSIITNPATDPHGYDATPRDAAAVAQAQYVIYNGAGYDPWMRDRLLKSSPSSSRITLDIASLVGKQDGDNPHLWYSPEYVNRVVDKVASQLELLKGVDRSAIESQRSRFESSGLKPYLDLISSIRQRHSGTPVGATESIFAYLSDALGLRLLTPPGYLKAITEGNDPTPADKATVDRQLAQRQIKVLVLNSQNSTPDVQSVVGRAEAEKIPVVEITETLTPANATFQAWQVRQLQALQQALASAGGG
jgi:zinc/manganese transport system substrate-binding protein